MRKYYCDKPSNDLVIDALINISNSISSSTSQSSRSDNVPLLHKQLSLLEKKIDDKIVSSLSVLEKKLSSISNKVNINRLNTHKCNPNGSRTNPIQVSYHKPKKRNVSHRCPLHLLIIVDQPPSFLIPEIRSTLASNNLVIHGKIKINDFRLKNGNIYIHCENDICKETIISLLEEKFDQIKVRSVYPKQSYLSFGPIPGQFSSADLANCITLNDARLTNHINDLKHHSTVKLPNGFVNHIFKIPKDLASVLLENPVANFRLQTIQIKEFIPLLQCHHCSLFGHTIDHCYKRLKTIKASCPNCSLDHNLRSCNSEFIPKCINCINYNMKNSASLDINHSSWEKSCIFRKSAIDHIISLTNKNHNNG